MRRILVVALLACMGAASSSYGADLLLLRGRQAASLEDEQIQSLAGFYGVTLKRVDIRSAAPKQLAALIKNPNTLAVLVDDDSADGATTNQILSALRARKQKPIPVVLFGITEATEAAKLRVWTNGAVDACNPFDEGFHPALLNVNGPAMLTRQLTGVELPAVTSPSCGLNITTGPNAETILTTKDEDGSRAPLLVRTVSHRQEVFLVPRVDLLDPDWAPTGVVDSFSSLAPFLVILSRAVGDLGWHIRGHYANLTIDDPWLIQPYGSLDYHALSREMEKHSFHTTIAFVPWNYDRSKDDPVSLFTSPRSRYSISVHGNNHAHREFGDYAHHSLSEQTADIHQGVARMERFTALTQIPYDPVMIFPHGVAPEQTFAELKSYGYLATANSSNVPLGMPLPRDTIFFLRPFTTRYANLLSLQRYSAAGDIPAPTLTIHAFLGNPILLYGHSTMFGSGIDAFNAYADLINRIQPDTRWASLGDIARHCYLLRRRIEGGFDVLMLSPEIDLENWQDTEQTFYLHRRNGSVLPGTLTLNGSPVQLQKSQDEGVVIPAHTTRRLRIDDETRVNLGPEEVTSGSAYVYALRVVSDLRDVYITRTSVGRSVVDWYYRNGLDSAELAMERNWWMLVIAIVIGWSATRYWRCRVPKNARQAARQ